MRLLLALVLIYGGAAAQTAAPTRRPAPQAATPSSTPVPDSALLVDNAHVRVWRLRVAPGATFARYGLERDHMLIAIRQSRFQLTAGQSGAMELAPGQMQVVTGEALGVRNTQKEPLELVVVEPAKRFDPQRAVCGLGQRPCGGEMGGSLTQGAFVYSGLFETDSFRVLDVTVDPRALVEKFLIRGEHLIVPITALRLRRGGEGNPTMDYQPGEAFWAFEGFTEGLENVGQEQARWVAVEVR